ncbi:hypothetical protein CIP107509_02451 [Corynebacterium diphtheriae]|nr:hypothetical protein CIP107509_02451 [Corynebacterium diphtheriae]
MADDPRIRHLFGPSPHHPDELRVPNRAPRTIHGHHADNGARRRRLWPLGCGPRRRTTVGHLDGVAARNRPPMDAPRHR